MRSGLLNVVRGMNESHQFSGRSGTWLLALIALTFFCQAVFAETARTCIVKDPHFRLGALLYHPKEGIGHKAIGRIQPPSEVAEPVWGLSQWNSKSPFSGQPRPSKEGDGYLEWSNQAKTIRFGFHEGTAADLQLGVNGLSEYPQGTRALGARWPALYLWQRFYGLPPIERLSKVDFYLDAKLHEIRNLHREGSYEPRYHAAQFTVFLTIQNRNKKSPDYGRYIWFGIPVYDSRRAKQPSHEQKDKFTGRFIYLVDYVLLSDHSIADREWVHMEADLLSSIRQALFSASDKGFFSRPVNLDDFAISSLNVGWETPGVFAARIQIKDLQVCLDYAG